MASAEKGISSQFDKYIIRQTELFSSLSEIADTCRDRIESADNEDERAIHWKILRSITAFESTFGQLESDFWAYWEGASETEYYTEIALAKGYTNFTDYLLAQVENCHVWIDELTTEVNALGWTWIQLDKLADEFWQLMDATEELIEARTGQLPDDELQILLTQIPPQRLAPIQVEVINTKFELKHANRSPLHVSLRSIAVAFGAIRSEARESLDDLAASNCDRRFIRCLEKLVASIDRDFREIQPVEIGINLVIVENAAHAIREEVAEALFGRLVGILVNVRQFISNFRDWTEYSNAGFQVEEETFRQAVHVQTALTQDLFTEPVRREAAYYADAAGRHSEKEGGKIRSAFVLGIQNIVGAVYREVLKYLRAIADKAASAIGTTIGTVATAWVALNLETLKGFARTHHSFSWMIDVIEFLQKHLPL